MRSSSDLRLGRDGAEHHAGILPQEVVKKLISMAARVLRAGPGVRLTGEPELGAATRVDGTLGRIAAKALGPTARPVRAVLFDKTAKTNWAVGWHQDRTIAVRERHEVEGFGPWSVKDGVLHVEPPFELIDRMVTLRAHLDDCGPDNAPLQIAVGSHTWGKVAADRTSARAAESEIHACLAAAGDVWAYRTSILHASERAKHPGSRRVLQVDFAAESLPPPLEWLGV